MLLASLLTAFGAAQVAGAPMQTLLQMHGHAVADPSRRTIRPMLEAAAACGLPAMNASLEAWANKGVVRRGAAGASFFGAQHVIGEDLRPVWDVAEAGTARATT